MIKILTPIISTSSPQSLMRYISGKMSLLVIKEVVAWWLYTVYGMFL